MALRIGIGLEQDGDVADCHLHQLVQPEQAPAVQIDPIEDAAVILYTSGTTGRPKGAVLTHANLASNAHAVAEALDLKPATDRFLVVLPMFHAFAGTVGILTPLLAGAALVPVPRFDPQAITQAIAGHHATIFLGVPSLYAVLMRLDDDQVAQWRSVRLCISGGAALPQALMQAFEQRFQVPMLEGDGPTECGPVTAVNRPEGPRKPGSIGPPIPGVEMRIADPEGHWLPDGEHGEVCVRGPSVMRGYWNLPEDTAQSFFGDWFRTGDVGWRDADGCFYLVDRIKDLIISNGINVYPRIIEEMLVRHPSVAEAAVVGEPNRVHGEIPIAYVTSAPQQQADDAELKAWCRQHLGSHEIPRRIEVVDALPKNAAGKILKRELRRAGEVERGVEAGRPPMNAPGVTQSAASVACCFTGNRTRNSGHTASPSVELVSVPASASSTILLSAVRTTRSPSPVMPSSAPVPPVNTKRPLHASLPPLQLKRAKARSPLLLVMAQWPLTSTWSSN